MGRGKPHGLGGGADSTKIEAGQISRFGRILSVQDGCGEGFVFALRLSGFIQIALEELEQPRLPSMGEVEVGSGLRGKHQ